MRSAFLVTAEARRQAAIAFLLIVLVGTVAHLFRSSPAVVAPNILADLGLNTAWVAYITGAFFVASVLTQIPAGIFFDRLGLRPTMLGLLLIAAAGAVLFAMAGTGLGLIMGRVLMGIGCGALIMGGVVLCARWTAPDQFAVVVGSLLAVAQIGNLASTAPMALLSDFIGWRGAFLCLAALAVLLAAACFLLIREHPPGVPPVQRQPETWASAIHGSWRILAHRPLWPVFAMAFVAYAAVFSIMGVWGGVYLHELFGLGLVARGNLLLLMTGGFALGLFYFGWLARRTGSIRRAVTVSVTLSAALFLALALVPEPPLLVSGTLIVAIGITGGGCGSIIPHGRRFYPPDSLGRGVTVLNTVVAAGAMAFQVYSGLLMDFLARTGLSTTDAFRVLFFTHAVFLALGVVAYRHAQDDAEPMAPAV